MPDNLNIRQPEDAKKINLNQPYEVSYWCNQFECTEKELRDAVYIVGNNAEAVRKYLGK